VHSAWEHADGGGGCAQAAEKEAAWFNLKVNTSVYVQGLPDDVTEAEMVQARPSRQAPPLAGPPQARGGRERPRPAKAHERGRAWEGGRAGSAAWWLRCERWHRAAPCASCEAGQAGGRACRANCPWQRRPRG
jgi:hypothetical protein